MRADLEKCLKSTNTNPADLCPLERVLLTTDGTLTDIIEAYLLEPIALVKLSEIISPLRYPFPPLALELGSDVVDRKILLRGTTTKRNYVYAETLLALERLDASFRDALLNSKTPLGRLWLEHKLETFKEIVGMGEQAPTPELCFYFDIQPEQRILMRTYRVMSNHQPLMLITEKFPRGIHC